MENIFRLVSESLARHELPTKDSEVGIQQQLCGAGALARKEQEPCGADTLVRANQQQPSGADTPVYTEAKKNENPDSDVIEAVPPSISSAWGAGFLEVQNRETGRKVRRPAPLPSGF